MASDAMVILKNDHHVTDLLCMELAALEPDAENFDAKVAVLIEIVNHHVSEEEDDGFRKARKALGRKELQQVGVRLEQERAKAPRRPEQPGALTSRPTRSSA